MSGEGVNNPADVTAILDIGADIAAIREITDAEPVLEETGGILTTDGTVQNLYINNAPAGIYRPVCIDIDFTNHTAGETVVIRLSKRMYGGGGWIEFDELSFAGVQDPLGKTIELLPTRFGIMVTIEKTVGTNRAYRWEAFYEVHP